ncbi:MAG TPA: hypothetical protein VG407_09405 [Caulobacteraceae bacterium]|nr:hypothetical protein [Caulobacteraceae bacterium]
MDIHKPKAWHGLREFLKEYGIIVLGVLTALGAEQAVESFKHESQVNVAERVLKENYAIFLRQRAELVAESACADKRLDELKAVVDQAAMQHRLGQVAAIPEPRPHSWDITGWDTLLSSQAAGHVRQEDMIEYAKIAHWAHDAQEAGTNEYDVWSTFQSLVGGARPFGQPEEAELRTNIARARHTTILLGDISRTTEQEILKTGRLTQADVDKARRDGAASPYAASMCTPISYRAVH